MFGECEDESGYAKSFGHDGTSEVIVYGVGIG
jgi:hypothetical protein